LPTFSKNTGLKIFNTIKSLQQYLQNCRQEGKTIGLVPTMGALHQGHLSLLQRSKEENNITVCSIFVNPTQFNDPKDLEKYPRPIDSDTKKLQETGCDVLFNPPVTEMYAENEQWHLNLGELEHLLEGKFRPGHYQGVTQVVYKLFSIVKPDTAYFGQKDYQQFMVISKMVQLLNVPVKLVMCPIVREADGLAMSSRNIHLSAADHHHALVLSRALHYAKDHFNEAPAADIKQKAEQMINAEEGTALEYFEIVDGETLQPVNPNSHKIVALVAARVGHTRLIDNVILR